MVNPVTGEVAHCLAYDTFDQVQLDTNPGFQAFCIAGGLSDHFAGLASLEARNLP
jgi:hypothetical protein